MNCIAKYSGDTPAWSAMGSGTYGVYNATSPLVLSFAVDGTNLYVGGNFSKVGGASGTTVNSITLYNTVNDTFNAVGGGLTTYNALLETTTNGVVYTVAYTDSKLYVGGSFNRAGSATATYVAKYSGETPVWSAMNETYTGVSGMVRSINVMGSDLYVGGDFTYVGTTGIEVNRAARFSSGAWTVMNAGSTKGMKDGAVYAIAVSGNDMYVGGSFTSVKGRTAGRFAKYVYSFANDAGSPVIRIVIPTPTPDNPTPGPSIIYWDHSQEIMVYKMLNMETKMWSPGIVLASGTFNNAGLSISGRNSLNASWSGPSGSGEVIGTIMPDGTIRFEQKKQVLDETVAPALQAAALQPALVPAYLEAVVPVQPVKEGVLNMSPAAAAIMPPAPLTNESFSGVMPAVITPPAIGMQSFDRAMPSVALPPVVLNRETFNVARPVLMMPALVSMQSFDRAMPSVALPPVELNRETFNAVRPIAMLPALANRQSFDNASSHAVFEST
ncbi:MAG: hypothetical protein Q8O57_08370, partial [Kiritimatiellota bacterium]|nr:hypothetical protein [Kiritimatiellota bacterium]